MQCGKERKGSKRIIIHSCIHYSWQAVAPATFIQASSLLPHNTSADTECGIEFFTSSPRAVSSSSWRLQSYAKLKVRAVHFLRHGQERANRASRKKKSNTQPFASQCGADRMTGAREIASPSQEAAGTAGHRAVVAPAFMRVTPHTVTTLHSRAAESPCSNTVPVGQSTGAWRPVQQ